MPTVEEEIVCDLWKDEHGNCGLHFHASPAEFNNARTRDFDSAKRIKTSIEKCLYVDIMTAQKYEHTLFTCEYHTRIQELDLILMFSTKQKLDEFLELFKNAITEFTK